jgi:hypothetical protein
MVPSMSKRTSFTTCDEIAGSSCDEPGHDAAGSKPCQIGGHLAEHDPRDREATSG